jgi:hypothetical protein
MRAALCSDSSPLQLPDLLSRESPDDVPANCARTSTSLSLHSLRELIGVASPKSNLALEEAEVVLRMEYGKPEPQTLTCSPTPAGLNRFSNTDV